MHVNIVHVHPFCNKLLQMQQAGADATRCTKQPMSHKYIGIIDDGGRMGGRKREVGREREGGREGGREG